MFKKKLPYCKNCDRYICPNCGGSMIKRGFEGHNGRYECYDCDERIECVNY